MNFPPFPFNEGEFRIEIPWLTDSNQFYGKICSFEMALEFLACLYRHGDFFTLEQL